MILHGATISCLHTRNDNGQTLRTDYCGMFDWLDHYECSAQALDKRMLILFNGYGGAQPSNVPGKVELKTRVLQSVSE